MQGYTEQKQIQQQRTVEAYHASPRDTYSAVIGLGIFSLLGVPSAALMFSLMWRTGDFFARAFVLLCCALVLAGIGVLFVWLYTASSNMWHRNYNVMIGRNLVEKNGTALLMYPNGGYDNITAQIVQAGIIPEPKDEPIVFEKSLQDTIIDLHNDGVGRPTILKTLQEGYPFLKDNQIRKIIGEYEDRKTKERERMLQG